MRIIRQKIRHLFFEICKIQKIFAYRNFANEDKVPLLRGKNQSLTGESTSSYTGCLFYF
jgi:hypothetical protein